METDEARRLALELIEHFRGEGTVVLPPATPAQLDAFEERRGLTLAAQHRELLTVVNGGFFDEPILGADTASADVDCDALEFIDLDSRIESNTRFDWIESTQSCTLIAVDGCGSNMYVWPDDHPSAPAAVFFVDHADVHKVSYYMASTVWHFVAGSLLRERDSGDDDGHWWPCEAERTLDFDPDLKVVAGELTCW